MTWRIAVAAAAWRSRRMLRDRRGVSAIEFAVIAPVMVLLYIGVVETANALTLYRRTAAVAATAADLTAQANEVTTADLQDITAASGRILSPFPTTPLKIVLTSVVADKNNVGKVAWSYASKGEGRATASGYTVPTGLTNADNSVIVAEVTYAFSPLLKFGKIFSPASFEMKQTFYIRPRKTLAVKRI